MPVKSQRLMPLVDLERDRENRAAKALHDAKAHLTAQHNRLEELEQYRNEYLEGFVHTAGGGLLGQRLQDYREFLGRLGEAIEAQKHAILRGEEEVVRTQRQWTQRHKRVAALDKAVARSQLQEQAVVERREQKDNDERANQTFYRRRLI